MKFLTKNNGQKWCLENQIALNEQGLPLKLEKAQKFLIPSDAGQRVALVKSQMEGFQSCEEVLIWINDWGVWESGERTHIFNRFRQSYGEQRLLNEVPVHLVKNSEYEDGVSIVTLAVLFLWDCFILTKGNEKFCFFSHDEYGLMLGKESEAI